MHIQLCIDACIYTHTNVTYVCVYLEKQMCINTYEPICTHAYISKLHVGAPQAVCELENVVYTCIHIYACVRVYICLCACVHCIERKKNCEKKKPDSHCGRGKKTKRKQNFINACFTCLRLNVTLLYIGVHIYIRTYAHTCGD